MSEVSKHEIVEFLERSGRGDMETVPLDGDASARRYFRLARNGGNVGELLMLSPREDLVSFVKVGEHLRGLGISAPKIYELKDALGLAVIEDFGDTRFSVLLDGGHDAHELYASAVDVLVHLHEHPDACAISLPSYDTEALIDAAELFVEWYLPLVLGRAPGEGVCEEFSGLWRELLSVPPRCDVLVLRDYHVDNLMLLNGERLSRCGVLDFQDSSFGSNAYDMMSLLEDARRDVSAELRTELLGRYFASRSGLERDVFEREFLLLSAQRHMRVAGVFCRLWKRDGKAWYLDYMPRVLGMLDATLQYGEFAGMRKFLDRIAPAWRDGLGDGAARKPG
ncbi:MAG: phosphotransferase [Hyphomicrobiales bacterium]|nr:phosphotransferase [Hyphomicrobiales bacterium]